MKDEKNIQEEQVDETLQDVELSTEQEQPDSTEEKADETDKLQEQIDDLKDKNLRMMAEFENYRRRTAREKTELREAANADMLRDMLPLMDDFERGLKALSDSEDVKSLREGIELIHQKFVGFLEKHGVTAIEAIGEPFSTEEHEAVTMFPATDENQKGKVIDCMQKGYKMGDKVIRYAKVVVGE